MKGSIDQPKIFISYSWTTPQHEQWVLELAERLSSDGIHVILDKWDLREGQDKHTFMEQMVNDKTIAKVLVICDRSYQEKADNRKGGVGTETQLISKEVYDNTGQEKFIPMVREKDKDGRPCMPHYMASRIYIDLSSDEVFEEQYEKLIRNLYGKPEMKRPPVGPPPAYIVEEEPVKLKTSHKVAGIKDAILNDRKSANGLITDYLDSFLVALEDFRLSGGVTPDYDEKVVASIQSMLPLRDDFIEFVKVVFKYQETVNLELFHDFLEKLIPLTHQPEHVHGEPGFEYDNFRFFLYELVLYFIALLLKLNRYEEAAIIVHSQFFRRNSYSGALVSTGIEEFNQYVGSLDDVRKKRLSLNRKSITADLLKERSQRKDISFNEVMDTDIVLYYLTELRGIEFGWFPRTSIYMGGWGGLELFDKTTSLRHFDRIKSLFRVKTVDEFKALIRGYIDRPKASEARYSRLWDYDLRPLERVFNLDAIGTIQ